MKITRKNQHFTIELELDEVEAKAIMHAFERLAYYANYPIDKYLNGVDADIYHEFKKLFSENLR